jgi:hypothetical protein
VKARAEGDLLSYLISLLPWKDLQGVRHRGRLPAKNAAQSVHQAMKGLADVSQISRTTLDSVPVSNSALKCI